MGVRKTRVSVDGEGVSPGIAEAGEKKSKASKQLSIGIPREVDFRLYSIARSEGIPKSELALRLLEAGLQRFGLDAELRSVWAEMCRKAGEAA
jgi:hypothetical protein